jgi:hypothetical protein
MEHLVDRNGMTWMGIRIGKRRGTVKKEKGAA